MRGHCVLGFGGSEMGYLLMKTKTMRTKTCYVRLFVWVAAMTATTGTDNVTAEDS